MLFLGRKLMEGEGGRLDEEEERRRMRKETNSCREGSKGARV